MLQITSHHEESHAPQPLPSLFEGFIGASATMRRVFGQLEQVARADSIVLVRGESGTGKELVAEAIHQLSRRHAGPFVPVNIAAVPEHLIESELFGHVKGAFTDASQNRIGRFEAASGGTLFIDEIGDLMLSCQAKLLRILENGYVTPVGGNDVTETNVRVIAATNRSLEKMVAEKSFREDLYYRLNVVSISLPPLRERREDIPLLIRHFLEIFAQAYQRPRPEVCPELCAYLCRLDWPGNVRQLRNCIESMVVLSEDPVLTPQHVPDTARAPATPAERIDIPPTMTLEELEKTAVRQALARCKGNRTTAARALAISVRTLQRKLKKWEREPSSFDWKDVAAVT